MEFRESSYRTRSLCDIGRASQERVPDDESYQPHVNYSLNLVLDAVHYLPRQVGEIGIHYKTTSDRVEMKTKVLRPLKSVVLLLISIQNTE